MNAAPLLVLFLAATWLQPRVIAGQARPPASPGTETASAGRSEPNLGAETSEASLDREVFAYPGGDRRDPFDPLLPGSSAGTSFEDLRLIGVIHSPGGGGSVALVSSGPASPAAATATGERTFRLRQDVVLGDMRVLRVERESVIVEIRRFGLGEQRALRLNRPSGRAGR